MTYKPSEPVFISLPLSASISNQKDRNHPKRSKLALALSYVLTPYYLRRRSPILYRRWWKFQTASAERHLQRRRDDSIYSTQQQQMIKYIFS